MVKVYIKKQSNYPVSAKIIKSRLKKIFENKGLVSDFTVNVSFVNDKTMLKLAKKYLNEEGIIHNVLSFPESEMKGDFKYPPGKITSLGEIVICYPKVIEEANKEGKLIDNKAAELVEHGALHLLGEHHE